MTIKKNWIEKLNDSKDLPKIVQLEGKAADKWGGGKMIIPSPKEVDEIMSQVPRGKLITISEIRSILSKKHNADIGCPLTSGIFAWIAANAAEEERGLGKKDITPYWRTLKTGGFLNEKYPGGIEQQKTFLEGEGHKIVQKGKKFMVENYEEAILWKA